MRRLGLTFIIMMYGVLTLNAEESLDHLLDTFVHNSDLSEKTRLQNAGNVIVYTREELDMMQANNLKDVLKSLPTMNYRENRLGIADPSYIIQDLPFNSNGIRIYIDDQEVTSSSYGSGLFLIGDIEIGFVDHIEVYSMNPAFEYSTEPAKYLIKLYSKVAARDKGSKAVFRYGSRGTNQQTLQSAEVNENFSHYAFLSRVDDQRFEHDSFDKTLSKDKKRYYLFSTLSSENHHLQLQYMDNERDFFIGRTSDARPNIAENRTNYLHLGYGYKGIENLKVNVTYEKGISKTVLSNDQALFRLDANDRGITIDTQYQWNDLEDNALTVGGKLRHKRFITDQLEYNGFMFPHVDYDTQVIKTLYLEDHYTLSTNWLFTLGAQMNKVNNNADVEDQDLWLARIGLIYSDENLVSKTFIHRSEYLIEPYLYTTTGFIVNPSLEPELVRNVTHEFQYKKDAYESHLVFGHSQMNNTVEKVSNGTVRNTPNILYQSFVYADMKYQFDLYNSLYSSVSYVKNKNFDDVDDFDQYKATLRLLNRCDTFDLFNELIYYHDTLNQTDYFQLASGSDGVRHYLDYSVGITYHYGERLTFALKGENLLNNAYDDYYGRGGRDQSGNWVFYETLYASPIDQRVYLSMEYLF